MQLEIKEIKIHYGKVAAVKEQLADQGPTVTRFGSDGSGSRAPEGTFAEG